MAALAVAAAALTASACGGSSPSADPRAGAVVRTVQGFAGATGPKACDLLTDAALARLYGGRAGCLARSSRFQPGEVKVEGVTIGTGGTRAVAQTRSLGGGERFTVVLQLVAPPGCRAPCPQGQWRIDSIKPR